MLVQARENSSWICLECTPQNALKITAFVVGVLTMIAGIILIYHGVIGFGGLLGMVFGGHAFVVSSFIPFMMQKYSELYLGLL